MVENGGPSGLRWPWKSGDTRAHAPRDGRADDAPTAHITPELCLFGTELVSYILANIYRLDETVFLKRKCLVRFYRWMQKD